MCETFSHYENENLIKTYVYEEHKRKIVLKNRVTNCHWRDSTFA